MKYVCIGKIVNTHGLKGEVRMLSSFKFKERVFKKNFKIYIGKEKMTEVIVSYRHHKIFEMICMEGYTDINEVLKYKGQLVYVNRDDLNLEAGEFLDEDLIGMKAYVEDRLVGVVKRVDKYPANDMLLIKGENKEYLVPLVKALVIEINLEEGKVMLSSIKGLIE